MKKIFFLLALITICSCNKDKLYSKRLIKPGTWQVTELSVDGIEDQKIPYSSRNIFFVLANSGCLFLAGGLIFENSFLIKGGIFILIVHALIDAHFIISKYQRKKSIEKEQEKSDAKK